MSRLTATFAKLRADNRAAFIPFITAGDPDEETSFAILERLPQAGADIIELGVPFSDPMADGPAIQASSQRALRAGMRVTRVLDMVHRFRKKDAHTPMVLMGYYNPVHQYGVSRFLADAASAGVDGLIVVDCGPEEDAPLRGPAQKAAVDIVRLAAPTTDDARLPTVLDGASGFLYYVSIAGVTGTKTLAETEVERAVARIHKATSLPCAVGFGIKTPEQAAAVARFADGAAVGSAIVARIAEKLGRGAPSRVLADDTLSFCRSLANAVHDARTVAVQK